MTPEQETTVYQYRDHLGVLRDFGQPAPQAELDAIILIFSALEDLHEIYKTIHKKLSSKDASVADLTPAEHICRRLIGLLDNLDIDHLRKRSWKLTAMIDRNTEAQLHNHALEQLVGNTVQLMPIHQETK